MPWKISTASEPPCAPAPLLGEHNQQVLGDLLGLPREMINELNVKVAEVARERATNV
jgi:hypothetical protein